MYKYINRTNRKEYMYNSLPRYSNPYLILHSSGNYKKSRHRLTNRKENKILVPHSRIHRTQSSTYKFIDRNVRERERKVPERWSHQLLVRRTPCKLKNPFTGGRIPRYPVDPAETINSA